MLEIRMVEGFDVANLGHIHFQFLGQQHGQRGMGTLSHLSAGHPKVDAPVRGDVQVGRQARACVCCGVFNNSGEAESQPAAS